MNLEPKDIPVVILAGGRGTRLMEETTIVPKPMVTVGGTPIIKHIMSYYGSYGFRKFVICLGYKGVVIKDYFLEINKHTTSVRIQSRSGDVQYSEEDAFDWDIALVETGEHSLTGTRLHKVRDYLDAECFCLTYGDGVSDVNLKEELAFHQSHGCIGTVAAVHPPSRFGLLDIQKDGLVESFQEKKALEHDYINGGYFFFNREMLDYLSADKNHSLESDPLSKLAEDGQLRAYRHEGFWQCMDTIRDRQTLEELNESGHAPWIR